MEKSEKTSQPWESTPFSLFFQDCSRSLLLQKNTPTGPFSLWFFFFTSRCSPLHDGFLASGQPTHFPSFSTAPHKSPLYLKETRIDRPPHFLLFSSNRSSLTLLWPETSSDTCCSSLSSATPQPSTATTTDQRRFFSQQLNRRDRNPFASNPLVTPPEKKEEQQMENKTKRERKQK